MGKELTKNIINSLDRKKLEYRIENNTIYFGDYKIDFNDRFYIYKGDNEIFSSDRIGDIERFVNFIVFERDKCYLLDIDIREQLFYKILYFDVNKDRYYVEVTHIINQGGGIVDSTKILDVNKENISDFLDESQKNGFLSNEQRKYLEGYIKL